MTKKEVEAYLTTQPWVPEDVKQILRELAKDGTNIIELYQDVKAIRAAVWNFDPDDALREYYSEKFNEQWGNILK